MGMSTKTKVLIAILGFFFFCIRKKDRKHVTTENFGLLD